MTQTFRVPQQKFLTHFTQPPPYLARRPTVGLGVALVSLAGFAAVTALVASKSPLIAWDAPSIESIHAWAGKQPLPLEMFLRFWSSYGRDGVALLSLGLMVGWLRRLARRPLWMLIFGFYGAELIFQIVGNLVNRPRPEFKDPFETLIGAGYPSGHAATNVVLGMIILYLLLPCIRSAGKRALLIVGVVLAVTLIILSRLFLGLHYPTDMIGGALMGLGWGALVLTITDLHFYPRGRRNAAVENSDAPGSRVSEKREVTE
jgi:undecaprenyl-diphosphatase